MDEDRKIRFLVAPIFFIVSLTWGWAHHSQKGITDILQVIGSQKLENLIATLFGAGITVFALGFIIGTITYVLLRCGFFLKAIWYGGTSCHEISLSDETLDRIWKKIKMPGQANQELQFFAGVTFDHDFLRKDHEGIHYWLIRRWNAVSVAATSVTGLLLSLVIGRCFDFCVTIVWWLPVAILCAVFCSSAILAWRDTMGMISFQAERENSKKEANV